MGWNIPVSREFISGSSCHCRNQLGSQAFSSEVTSNPKGNNLVVLAKKVTRNSRDEMVSNGRRQGEKEEGEEEEKEDSENKICY